MSIWQWVDDYHRQAYDAQDLERLHLVELFFAANRAEDVDPNWQLSLLDEGLTLARRLAEPWWELCFTHLHLLTLMADKGEYSQALDKAIQATVTARKPAMRDCPQRICVHEDLIRAYMGIDPLGYAPQIEQALSYMEQEVSPKVECYHCLLGKRAQFELKKGNADKALSIELNRMARLETRAEDDKDDYRINVYLGLCAVVFKQKEWAKLAEYASLGMKAIERSYWSWTAHRFIYAAWQACAAAYQDKLPQAKRFARQAINQAERWPGKPPTDYYDALCAFHLRLNEPARALELRQQQLLELVNTGQLATECQCRLEICRLLAQLGQPITQAIAETRTAAQRLKNPERILSHLDALC